MLRVKIEELLKNCRNPQETAIQICIFLEDTIDLYGNGWFDDDSEMERRLEEHWKSLR